MQLSLTRPDLTRATQGLYTRVKDQLGTQKKKSKAINMQEQRNTRKHLLQQVNHPYFGFEKD